MAAFNRPTQATYEIHEKVTVDTLDNEDHTFCGIMFPIKCKNLLPLDHILVKSVAVRGRLGPLTVWISNPSEHGDNDPASSNAANRVRLDPKYWTKLHDQKHKESAQTYKQLDFTEPVKLTPGETRVVYIHSTLPGDQAIVYDNSHYGMSHKRFEDDKLAIMSGRAHVSNDVFGQEPIWGWGNAWRDRREFVGRLEYGTVYKLWNPHVQPQFGSHFQNGARALVMCQRRWESPLSRLPDECIYYILNMLRWDWFEDTSATMKSRRKREKERRVIKEEAAEAARIANTKEESSCCKVQAMDTDHADDQVVLRMGTEASSENDEAESEMDDDEWNSDDDLDDESSGEEYQYHNANERAFQYVDMDSDDDSDDDGEQEDDTDAMHGQTRRHWIRSQIARLSGVRAIAHHDIDGRVTHVDFR